MNYDCLRCSMGNHSMDLQSVLLECMLNGGGIGDVSRIIAEYFNASVSFKDTNNSNVSNTEQMSADSFAYIIERDINAGGHHLGRLVLKRNHESFSDAETQLFEKVTDFVALQLYQDKKIADIEFRLRGNFIEDLISFHFTDQDSIKKRARAIDYDITTTHRVLVAEFEDISHIIRHQNRKASALESFKSELAKNVNNRLNQLSDGMVMNRNDEMIILIRVDEKNTALSTLKSICEEIIDFVHSQYNVRMYIGIGNVCTELADFSKSYRSAKKSLEIGEYMITEGQVRSLEQFSVHALFLSTVKPSELYNYARAHLERLLDYDKKHGSELLKTLQEYLYLRNNVEKTARAINLSVSGLKYRLKRIEKIIGLELNDYKVSFDLQLALVIMQLYGEYRIRGDIE